MNIAGCCDAHCATCQICYLKLLRPGDTVPFKKPKYLLPLGVSEIMLAFVVIVFDALAIFCQSQALTSPPPSFIGSPGIIIWLSALLICDGFTNVSAYKRKTRFTTAIAFGFSTFATLIVVILLAIVTMAISQEAAYYEKRKSATGIVISSVICCLLIMLLVITSTSALLCYVSLSSHDDRWFTDRGTQHDQPAPSSGYQGTANLSVPSGKPAFLFYAPSAEAEKYSCAFTDVMKELETRKGRGIHVSEEAFYEETIDGRKTADLSEDGETFIGTAPPSANRATMIPENFPASITNP